MIRLVCLLVLVPSLAFADDRHATGFSLNTGVEIMGSGEAVLVANRTHATMTQRFTGNLQLGIGATLGLGEITVDDRRALDGNVPFGYRDYGPELQLGFGFGDGFVKNRVFASAAYLRTDVKDHFMAGRLHGGHGARVTIGANWARAVGTFVAREKPHSSDSSDELPTDFDWVGFLLPQQVEFGWERSAGSDRWGVTLSWGI